MIGIITGDVIQSSQSTPTQWMPALKEALTKISGTSPKKWEIYRGDSFQLEVPAEKALESAMYIKAGIKQFRELDVRMAIGIGEKTYDSDKITESNGSAFVHSGKCFEYLKKKTLAIKSAYPKLDQTMNLMIQLAMLTADRWAVVTAEIVQHALLHPDFNQTQLAESMHKTQSAISEGLKRAGFEEITKMIEYYESLY